MFPTTSNSVKVVSPPSAYRCYFNCIPFPHYQIDKLGQGLGDLVPGVSEDELLLDINHTTRQPGRLSSLKGGKDASS